MDRSGEGIISGLVGLRCSLGSQGGEKGGFVIVHHESFKSFVMMTMLQDDNR